MKKILYIMMIINFLILLSACSSESDITDLEDFPSHIDDSDNYDYNYLVINNINYLYDYSTGYATVANCLYNATDVIIDDFITIEDTDFPVKVIGKEAFSNCISLKSVVIGDNITEIGDGAFKNSYYLSEIIIPSNVKVCNYNLFENCNKNLLIYLMYDEVPDDFDSNWCLDYDPILLNK